MHARPATPARWRPWLVATVVALVLAGCSHGSPKPSAAASSSTSTSTSTTTTTTTAPPRPRPAVYPLTGLPVTNKANARRPALSIKVENSPDARPQAGLNQADLVTEELVEGGITRFMVTFQSQNAALVGPVRSARPEDGLLLRELGGGILGYAGAAAGAFAPVQHYSTSVFLGIDQATQDYFRVSYRFAPHNLFTTTPSIYATYRSMHLHKRPPPQLFHYSSALPGDAVRLKSVFLPFSYYTPVDWTWSAPAHAWLRSEMGSPMTLIGGQVASATNVVIMRVHLTYIHGMVDVNDVPVPISVVLGSGPAWVLRDGHMISGRWSRPSANDRVKLEAAGGRIISLQPGRTWIELLPYPAAPKFTR